MRNLWTDERNIDPEEYTPAPGRNLDSSVAAQYEDSVPPEPDEAYDPS